MSELTGGREPQREIDETVAAGVGAAVRRHRDAAGLSTRDLAGRSGLSQPFLSNIENGRAMPSIATLYRLADALDVGPQDFLPRPFDSQVQLVRAGEGVSERVTDEPDSPVSRLLCGAPGRLIEAHVHQIEPGEPIDSWFEHAGEDLVLVMEGSITVEFGDGRRLDVDEGDVLWHVSTLRHRWSVPGATRARVLLVNARPVDPPSGDLHQSH